MVTWSLNMAIMMQYLLHPPLRISRTLYHRRAQETQKTLEEGEDPRAKVEATKTTVRESKQPRSCKCAQTTYCSSAPRAR